MTQNPQFGFPFSAVRPDFRDLHLSYATISLSVTPGTRRGRYALVGLVLFERTAGHSPIRAEAHLSSSTEESTTDSAEVDELGNFGFDDLAPGVYQIEIRVSDRSIVVEALHIGD